MNRTLVLLAATLLGACAGDTAPPAAVSAAPIAAANLLEMSIDGKPWKADHALFGAVNPPGYPRTVLMAGSLGPKDAKEQAFNLNVTGIDGPGRYVVRTSEGALGNAAQISNLSSERFLVGNVFGFDLTVDIAVAQSNPTRVEARFSGTLTANDGQSVTITDGRFSYRE